MKTGVNGKARFEHFYGSNAVELQLPIPRTASSFGKAHRLPADQHNVVAGGAANAVRMNHARQQLARKGNPASALLLRGLPQQLCDLFHSTQGLTATDLNMEKEPGRGWARRKDSLR